MPDTDVDRFANDDPLEVGIKDEFKVNMGLRQAKDTIDAIGEGRTVDLSIGYQ